MESLLPLQLQVEQSRMDIRQIAFNDHRNKVFILLATFTSGLAMTPNSTVIPIVIALAILLVYSSFLFRPMEPNRIKLILLTWLAISVGTSCSRIQPSLRALSTPAPAVFSLFILSLIPSFLSLATLYAGVRFSTHSASSWSQITLFPALWSSLWCAVSHIVPIGYLGTWSVANGTDAYNWLVPFAGPACKDWIVAAWAVIVSQLIGRWYIGSEHDSTEIKSSKSMKFLFCVLTFLTLPSFIPNLPLPAWELDISTPVTVGCALPSYDQYRHHDLTLEDYVKETEKIRSSARIILWPEGAVTFRSSEEKEDTFKQLRYKFNGSYVGVSFEEIIENPADPSGRQSLKKTGLAIISHLSEQPHLIYYKRHLVPFGESYHLSPSSRLPDIFEVPLGSPKGIPKDNWSSLPNYTRPIPLTSSICLDFAMPSPFGNLVSRPALILAPARTWDSTVGYAMWLQAKQRAEELNSIVLWCDGGKGGVSGVAGGAYSDVSQAGSGSFIRTIGIQYPFDTSRTPYAHFGNYILILFWLFVFSTSSSMSRILIPDFSILTRFLRSRNRVTQNESTVPNLLDL